MDTLKVHMWEKWQSYRRDRGQPPWIKVHRTLLRHRNWIMLTDAQKGQLVSMWMLAADDNGEIPNDAQLLQRLCQLECKPELNVFIDLGFFDAKKTPGRRQNDNQMSAQRQKQSRGREEAEKTLVRSRSDGDVMTPFDEFWREYPKKVGKGAARKAWEKLNPCDELAKQMTATVIAMRETEQWQKNGGQFVPNPATWLNQSRWEDEIPEHSRAKHERRVMELLGIAG